VFDKTIAEIEAEVMQNYYGDLPWLDLPTEAGWYWYRTVPSRVVRGPVEVRLIDGRLMGEVRSDQSGFKPAEQFQRQWAGPLGRPIPIEEQGKR
jgi:hypothetical protein